MWRVILAVLTCLGILNPIVTIPTQTTNDIENVQQCVGSEKEPICLTPGCIHAASDILKTMDETVDPCEDFYHFTCGKFMKETVIPDDKTSVSKIASIQEKVQKQLKLVLEESPSSNELRPFTLAKQFYNMCMNITATEEDNLATIKALLRELGGWPVLDKNWKEDTFNWKNVLYKAREMGFSHDSLLTIEIILDFHNSSRHIVVIDQVELPIREILLQGFEADFVQKLYANVVDLSVIFGADKEFALQEIKEVLQFQIQLANITLPQEQRTNFTALTNMMTVSEIQQKFPSIPWRKFLNNIINIPEIEISDEEVIDVIVPNFIADLELLLARTPKRVQANYIFSNIVFQTVEFLTTEVKNRISKFEQAISGTKQTKPKWKTCVDTTATRMDAAVGALYVRKYADKNVKKKTEELVADLQNAFVNILKQVQWMDENTRSKAIEKAMAMAKSIAYPEEFLDDKKLKEFYAQLEPSENMLRFFLNTKKFSKNLEFKKLREPVNNTNWMYHTGITQTNAFNNLMENGMMIPLGILHEPVFKSDRPNYMNYGGLGFIVAHEITHGFDSEGRQFDKSGMVADWWNEETARLYNEKTQCIVEQYGNYTVPEINMKINGILTKGENIADNGGMKEAYLAYEAWVARNGEEARLPGLNYTPKQLFWISAANVWCTKPRKEILEMLILMDPHSPAYARIMGTFSNNEYFAKDFKCHKGSTMNPEHKCHFW